ncbi:hypothetical protein M8J75_000816 [Diaphorina citri]|nr:hypothetical protein M8J75_000816 [Diaphorina citri]
MMTHPLKLTFRRLYTNPQMNDKRNPMSMLFSLEQYESFSHFWDKCWDVILFYAIPTLIIVCYNVLYKAMT